MMIERRKRVEQGLKPGPESRASEVTDSLVQDRMALYGVPGMSVAIIDEGRVDWADGYGTLAGDDPQPVNEFTLFQCCSTSKMIAALTALRLVADGKLSLDADVNKTLTDWKLRDSVGAERRITLRQILSHTGGINVHGAPGYARGSDVPTLDQVLDGQAPAITAPVRVMSEPARTFRYSGGGYCVMQRMIEIVSGTTFEEAARQLVLDPLAMAHSTFAQPLPEALWPQAAAAHLTLERTPASGRWFVYPEQAVGGLWTCSADLAQVVIELHRAAIGRGRVLDQDLYKEMSTVHTDNWNSGLGAYITNGRDPATACVSHLGAHLGWQAVLMAYPTLGKGAVVLTNNGYTGSELYTEFLLSASAEYCWPKFTGSFR